VAAGWGSLHAAGLVAVVGAVLPGDAGGGGYLAGLGAKGMSQDYIEVQKMIYRVVRLNISALPNHTVHRLTGTPATSFAQFVRDHHQVWSPDREGDA